MIRPCRETRQSGRSRRRPVPALRRQASGVGPPFALGAGLFVGVALGVELIEILLGPSRVGTLELALTMMLPLVQLLFVTPATALEASRRVK